MYVIIPEMKAEADSISVMPSQVELWNKQHLERGTTGMEASALRDTPSDSATLFATQLGPKSSILKIGPGHGRDARYWAGLGHHVFCADFSSVALDQLGHLAREQGVQDNIHPILHDISDGTLPDTGDIAIDGFYARSSLHIDDETMLQVAVKLNTMLSSSGVILIEGKGSNDHKIRRGIKLGKHLVVDPFENGHLRRVWTEEFMMFMCKEMGWGIDAIEEREEEYKDNTISFIRLLAKKR